MASEFEKTFGMTQEEVAERFAPICEQFINSLRDADCPMNLGAYVAGRVSEALIRVDENPNMASMLAIQFIALHLELGGTGVTMMPVPEPGELN